jgi:hypothetical protein
MVQNKYLKTNWIFVFPHNTLAHVGGMYCVPFVPSSLISDESRGHIYARIFGTKFWWLALFLVILGTTKIVYGSPI